MKEINLRRKMARDAVKKGKYAAAIPLLNEILKEHEEFVSEWKMLGVCYFRTGEAKKALKCFDTAISKNPLDPFSYRERGKCHMELKEYEKALKNFHLSLELTRLDEKKKRAEVLITISYLYYLQEDETYLDYMKMAYRTEPEVTADSLQRIFENGIMPSEEVSKKEKMGIQQSIAQVRNGANGGMGI